MDMGWDVVQTEGEGVHVLPCPSFDHVPRRDCACHPTPKRDGPLDDPVWSHHEPTHPGSNEGVN